MFASLEIILYLSVNLRRHNSETKIFVLTPVLIIMKRTGNATYPQGFYSVSAIEKEHKICPGLEFNL